MRLALAAGLALVSWMPSTGRAFSTYYAEFPYPTFGCATCHYNSGGGGPLNYFGADFSSNGRMWSAHLAGLDSDGDGVSNEAELTASPPTHPGLCDDPDQCATGADDCAAIASCHNRCPGFSCVCPTGYSGDGRTCADVDECTFVTGCAPGACVNTPGSYRCECPSGYVPSSSGRECLRAGTCRATPDACAGGTCVDTEAGHRCECPPGTALEMDRCAYRGCTIDPCRLGATCAQVHAGYHECLCPSGYTFDGGTCRLGVPSRTLSWDGGLTCPMQFQQFRTDGITLCDDFAGCVTLTGDEFDRRYVAGEIDCACNNQFDQLDCFDANQCSFHSGCSSTGFCVDEFLSFYCDCRSGTGGRHTCRPLADCDAGVANCCGPGYTWDAATDTCIDEDECARAIDPCGAGTCTNEIGTYACACPSGYTASWYDTQSWGQVVGCFDVDECISAPCGGGRCVNEPGSYRCDCDPGFRLVGGRCADVDECTEGAPCGAGTCTNRFGSYDCTCPTGFEVSAGTCVDVDECARGAVCEPGVPCTNVAGDYVCGCTFGYRLEDGACADVDECAEGFSGCDPVRSRCVNSPGAYTCECTSGYARDAVGLCADVDECAAGTDECGEGATCMNTLGTYACTCPEGFVLLGTECVPADPCTDGTVRCAHQHEVCVDPEGAPAMCVCGSGYVRDGSACVGLCGDGILVAGEACDDGNTAAGDGCSACALEPGWRCDARGCERTCGDGLIDEGEACDDGDGRSDTRPNACRSDCRAAHCGDRVIDDGERCDDGSGDCRTCGDAPDGGADGGITPPMEGGCGCRAGARGAPWLGVLVAFALFVIVRRRRAQRRGGSGAVQRCFATSTISARRIPARPTPIGAGTSTAPAIRAR